MNSSIYSDEIDLFESTTNMLTQVEDCLDFAVMHGVRISEVEEVILTSPEYSILYAQKVIKGRWPEAEQIFAGNCSFMLHYASKVIKSRWPEAEESIRKDATAACTYAKDAIGGRWLEAESVILTNVTAACVYARDVIKGRWPEAESKISRSQANVACEYAVNVVKDRWPEAESLILEHSSYAKDYVQSLCYAPENKWWWLKEGPITQNLVLALNIAGMDKEMQEYVCKNRPDFVFDIWKLDPVLAHKYQHEINLSQVDI